MFSNKNVEERSRKLSSSRAKSSGVEITNRAPVPLVLLRVDELLDKGVPTQAVALVIEAE